MPNDTDLGIDSAIKLNPLPPELAEHEQKPNRPKQEFPEKSNLTAPCRKGWSISGIPAPQAAETHSFVTASSFIHRETLSAKSWTWSPEESSTPNPFMPLASIYTRSRPKNATNGAPSNPPEKSEQKNKQQQSTRFPDCITARQRSWDSKNEVFDRCPKGWNGTLNGALDNVASFRVESERARSDLAGLSSNQIVNFLLVDELRKRASKTSRSR
jgi:hypothetical protein